MGKPNKTVGFRCYDLEMYNKIVVTAKENGLTLPKYIERTVLNVVDGKAPDIAQIEKLTIDMMGEVQTIKGKHPQVDVSGLERIGEKLLWQIS